jgi:Leucine-rich repeat (LRR) protein
MVLLPSIEPLQELVCLHVNDNGLDALPVGLEALTKLDILDFGMNVIKEVSGTVLQQLTNLTSFNIRQNQIRSIPGTTPLAMHPTCHGVMISHALAVA